MTKAELVTEIAKQAGIEEFNKFNIGIPRLAWKSEDEEIWEYPILLLLPWGAKEEVGYIRELKEGEEEIYFYQGSFSLALEWVREKGKFGEQKIKLPTVEVGVCEYCKEHFKLSAGEYKIYKLADLIEYIEKEGEEKMRDGYGHHAGLCYDLARAIREAVINEIGKEVKKYFPIF